MKNPEDPRLWRGLHDHAAQQLSSNFADRVLREARQEKSPAKSAGYPFALSAFTAVACLLLAIAIHTQTIQSVNARHLAQWQQLAADLDTLNDL